MRTIELINLTLNEIRRSAQCVADVMSEQSMILKYDFQLDNVTSDVLENGILRKFNALEKCQKALRDVLEDIAELQNDCDMVEGVDAALGKVAYDLIYERTTDEDYEPNRQTE